MTAKIQTTQLTTTDWTLIYTAPAAGEASAAIEFANDTGADVEVGLAWMQSDTTPGNVAAGDIIWPAAELPDKNVLMRGRRKVPADASLFAKTSAATINVTVSAVED